ncbi:MAG: hypothetical protein ABI231_04705 [Candidatus Tumulicola sp.]
MLRRSVFAGMAIVVAVAIRSSPATAATTREALIARWTAANHRPARLLEPGTAAPVPPPNLGALAARELATAGRYRVAASRRPAATPGTPWWMRVLDWLRDGWTQLWSAAFGRARLGRGGAIVIGDLLIAGALLSILFASYRLLSEFAFERRSRGESLEPIGSPADAGALYREACERARVGEYGTASRLLYNATVSALALRGVVRDDRGATVGDFRRVLRHGEAALVLPFDAVSAAFVTSAYAELPVEASQWERARLAYLSLAGRGES